MSKIIRAPRPEKNWTEISNDVLRDKSLSYRARGILARLLSNADGFAMNADDLAEESPGEGRDAVRKSLSELQNSGYLQRVKSQDERGRWRTDYTFTTPLRPTTDFQSSVYRRLVYRRLENRPSVNQSLLEITKRKNIKKNNHNNPCARALQPFRLVVVVLLIKISSRQPQALA